MARRRTLPGAAAIAAAAAVLFLSATTTTTTTTTAAAATDRGSELQEGIVSWVRSKGGSFSEKIEIRRVDPSDPSSYWGVFVRENESVEKGEDLFRVPRECYLDVFEEAEPMGYENMDAAEEAYHRNLCKLSKKLGREMEAGEASDYAPYLAYLATQRPGQLPANWSPQGKDLLRKIATPGSHMVDWIDRNFVDKGCIAQGGGDGSSSSNERSETTTIGFERHMVEMTVQRCFDTALIPIWDMVNHDNGRINTENDTMHAPGGLAVRAAKGLAGGEELFATYDGCVDCFGIDEYWGTPEILKDFGFVENYPHRWVFVDQDIWFEIWEAEEGKVVYYGEEESDDEVLPYGQEQMDFLENERMRLEAARKTLLQTQGAVPDHEWEVVLRYHAAASEDLRTVLLSQKNKYERWDLEREL